MYAAVAPELYQLKSLLLFCFTTCLIDNCKLSSHSVTINIIVKIHINYSIGQAFCVCYHQVVTMNIARIYHIRCYGAVVFAIGMQ